MNLETFESEIRRIAAESGFSNATELLLREARPCGYLIPTGNTDDFPMGATRMGGAPDLTSDRVWPTGLQDDDLESKNAQFLVQINLGDLAPIHDLVLPHIGLLSVFIRRVAGIQATLYFEAASHGSLERREPPSELIEDSPLVDEPEGLSLQSGFDLPFGRDGFEDELHGLCPNASESKLRKMVSPPRAKGQVGGYAFDDRGRDMAIWAASADARTPSDWMLLLKFHLFDVIYLLIYCRRSDLMRGDFSRVRIGGLPWRIS
jgi:hypothetical protein